MKLPAVLGGSFEPILQINKLEIHKVCLRFLFFNLCQNLSPITLVNSILGYELEEIL